MSVSISVPNDGALHETITYPAGELQVRILADKIPYVRYADNIVFNCRISNSTDLMELILLNDAVSNINPTATRILMLPYLPYSRADRRFVVGDCHGLAAFGKLINACNFTAVVTLDVHNKQTAKLCINRLVNIMPTRTIDMCIKDFAGESNYITVLLPDAGALARYHIEAKPGLAVRVLSASKKRNPVTGKLTEFTVPSTEEIGTSKLLIIDDICDAGGTFIGLANALCKNGYNKMLGLYVTHGIFSKGTASLRALFSHVYCTDSISLNVYDNAYLRPNSAFLELTLGLDDAKLKAIKTSL